ncbi:MAG: regulatory iron-sulfur-containing complex subunit RicT [Patescibacteria group bacterium]|jgi:cell fate regulator YaaT (PSP1 superfamily)|nr:regulatory iron-sulfur-containing complex subunit RicT [Patescibacteria group bacterium]
MIVRLFDWDQPKNVFCGIKGAQPNDWVVIDHEWGGTFLGKVLFVDKNVEGEESIGRVIRKASAQDHQIILNNEKKQREYLNDIKKQTRELDLPMKMVEVCLSLDSSSMVAVFIADGRIDFRDFVKKLSTQYHKSVRFQQIGSRDEARKIGGCGVCGREVCCKKFPGNLKSISTEMARCQLISHRGSERISGVCGRLMCCLAYEADQYEELLRDMPKRDDKVKAGKIEGTVVEVNPISQKVKVKISDGSFVSVDNEEAKVVKSKS